ncbi:nucleoside/nucleotide kinase family protein [Streptomyces antimicrobicus]|uniref:Nucleoside/nucleotide kinase family protein n=1 Tax=Streptomyces antimicrobicus TaxID=2883108 RepID=A0ABS8BAB6_9ACTN|nr:nucleoside/nucleotide kinase family protein [Streptomyces antimicrobicus]MCB5181556.1 nucleoside/nucleotide kinase family protein [Streptomyces antimicrobicus]
MDRLELERRARALATAGGRRLLGIAGPPGAGKSTLAGHLAAALGPDLAVVVPMDGFHLAQAELVRLGRADRKGAPDTFDAAGYAALLRRLREPGRAVVYAPAFDRSLEEPVAGSIAVGPGVPLVITEGNYLLHEAGEWSEVAPLLDEVWYLAPDDALRVRRLTDRHVRHGKDPDRAAAWVARSDEANARLVAAGRPRADLVLDGPLDLGAGFVP